MSANYMVYFLTPRTNGICNYGALEIQMYNLGPVLQWIKNKLSASIHL